MSNLPIKFEARTPEGVICIKRLQRTWRTVAFPRLAIKTVKRLKEFNQPGVYLLLGYDAHSGRESIYIGEGDPVSNRLLSHEKQKNFWTRGIFFVTDDDELNKAHIQFLEARLISSAKSCGQLLVINDTNPSESTLSTTDKQMMQELLHYIMELLPVLGVYGFIPQNNLQLSIDPQPAPIHRKRGRPRKTDTTYFTLPQSNPSKRKRGRPRKNAKKTIPPSDKPEGQKRGAPLPLSHYERTPGINTDCWGYRIGTKAAVINATLSKNWKLTDTIEEETKIRRIIITDHLFRLIKRGIAEKSPDRKSYRLLKTHS